MPTYHRRVETSPQDGERLRAACLSPDANEFDRRLHVMDLLRRMAAPELNLFRSGSVSTIHLRGLPVDDLSATPIATPVANAVAMGLASVVGHPYAYVLENEGVLQDVQPKRRNVGASTSTGATEPLGFHTDLDFFPSSPAGPFDRTNPDAIVLVAVRPDRDRNAETLFVDARDIHDSLPRATVRQLSQPKFRLPSSYSFVPRPAKDRPWSHETPLLRPGTNDVLVSADLLPGAPSRNDLNATAQGAQDAPSGRALNELRDWLAADAPAVRVKLDTGDALIISNRRGLHARCAFQPTFDHTDRWLKRVYVRSDLSVFSSTEQEYLIRDPLWT